MWWQGKVVGQRRRYDHHTLRMLIERGNRSERRRLLTQKEKLAAAHPAARAVGMRIYNPATREETNAAILAQLDRIDARTKAKATRAQVPRE